MSLQWTLIASFLYFELALCIVLMIPFISPTSWKKIFNSRIFCAFKGYANFYFNIFIVILIVVFLDGVRDVHRFTNPTNELDMKNNPLSEVNLHMKLFRAQRNFYIAGFALFLFLFLRKLTVMILKQATLTAQCDAIQRQATSATEAAQRLLDESSEPTSATVNSSELSEKIQELQEKLETSEQALEKSNKDLEAIKSQAISTNTEYDRLMGEHALLQEKFKTVECGSGESKKDD